jgi:acetyl coenzyme A synthetase (ADP forming)-like protein
LTTQAAPTQPASREATALDAIFRPRAIAVIGATPKAGTIGRQILHNLSTYEFTGSLFPVNPKYSVVHSIKCYPDVRDIPDTVDLAYIIVPRQVVVPTIDACAEKGIRGVVVISAGFKEVGGEGARLEEELQACVRGHGIRMIGPNSFGVINTDPAFRVNGTFGKPLPRPGRIALVSQSGALGETILVHAEELGTGFSMFASIGNKTDLSGKDLLQYWQHDPHTDVILMYLENFGDPRRFTRIAREVSRSKPIIAVKAGRTAAGARAARSHTGALAGRDVSVDALFEQTGVIRVSSIQDMFDVALGFVSGHVPKGRRVCVVTNAGGPGILATDALVAHGLEMAPLSTATKDALREQLPEQASVENPVDLIASADASRYAAALDLVASDPATDAVVTIFVPPLMIDAQAVGRKLIETAARHSKPMLNCLMGVRQGAAWIERIKEAGLPVYSYPESIALTLAAMERWRQWRERPEGRVPRFDVDREGAAAILRRAQGEPILGADAIRLLECYGIPTVPTGCAASSAEAVDQARRCGYPVALKLLSPDAIHKSEVGGVRLDLRSDADVQKAFEEIEAGLHRHRPQARFDGVSVQAMAAGGTELVVGLTTDPQFGPLVMFGMGGIFVEILKDVVFRVHPVSDRDALEMITGIHGYPLLQGARGRPVVDPALVADVILRVSQMATDLPEIDQVDINPLVAGAGRYKVAAVDARIIPAASVESAGARG